jgi:hypothetical protein
MTSLISRCATQRRRFALLFLSAAAFAACGRAPDTDPKMLSEWMRSLYGIARTERLSPPVAARFMAYASSALYSGMAATSTRMPSLAGTLREFPALPAVKNPHDYDQTLTAVAAEHVVLDSILREALPTTHASVARLADSLATARVATGVSNATKLRSDSLGRQIGLAIVAWSHGDGFDSTRGRPYVVPVGIGKWINDSVAATYATLSLSRASELVTPTNPTSAMSGTGTSDRDLILGRVKRPGGKTLPAVNMAGATEPYWNQLRPFTLERWDVCPAPYPPPYSRDTLSPLYKEARVVYETVKQLTPDQKHIALFWADNGGETGTPVGHWLSIVSQMVSERHLDAEKTVRVMTETSVSLADVIIATWGYKYRVNFLRPRTYIRAIIDTSWNPTIPTPPFPEYLSGHSAISAAAAGVLTSMLGGTAFEDSTGLAIGQDVRRFVSFDSAAVEAGQSRVYGGIHFPSGNVQGQALGRCVASKVVARFAAGLDSSRSR